MECMHTFLRPGYGTYSYFISKGDRWERINILPNVQTDLLRLMMDSFLLYMLL